jgi:hypothetical protein
MSEPAANNFFNKNILVKLSKKFLNGRGRSDEVTKRFAPNLLNQRATFLEGVRLPDGRFNLIIKFDTGQTLAGLDMDDLEWLPE